MKLIKPSYQIIEQKPGLDGIYEQVELAGRTCYKSQRPEGQTAKDFVDRMIAMRHRSMLEHGTVYLKIPVNVDVAGDFLDDISTWTKCKLVKEESGNWWAVTTNYRRIIELKYQDHLKYLCEPTEFHKKRITVRFITGRDISHELVRHRVFSFAQESTRYCNYSKDKFGNELTFIIPSWMDKEQEDMSIEDRDICGNTYAEVLFKESLLKAEKVYLSLLKEGWKPQQARQVLPNALKTELVITGFISDWEYFFRLRTSIIAETGKPHPDMSNLCDPLYKEFVSRGYIRDKF